MKKRGFMKRRKNRMLNECEEGVYKRQYAVRKGVYMCVYLHAKLASRHNTKQNNNSIR